MKRTEAQFFSLLRSGLWGSDVDAGLFCREVDWKEIFTLARDQTVIGLVADGLENLMAQAQRANVQAEAVPPQGQPQVLPGQSAGVQSSLQPQALPGQSARPEAAGPAISLPLQRMLLRLADRVIRTEQANRKQNIACAELTEMLRQGGSDAVVVKGQGVAQAYINPLRRQCGDIDLLLTRENYEKAKPILDPTGKHAASESRSKLHYECDYKGITVELHGTLDGGLNAALDRRLDQWRDEMLSGGVRIWDTPAGPVQLPPHNFDAIYIFVHFYHHFLLGGQGLRQICDWARYLYTYREDIDFDRLRSDVLSLGLERGWKVFASMIVDVLGCPSEVVPLYDSAWMSKAKWALKSVFITGNFGHKQEAARGKESFLMRKIHSFFLQAGQMLRTFVLCPGDTMVYFVHYCVSGVKRVFKGKM